MRPRIVIGATAALLSLGGLAYTFEAPRGYGVRVDWQAALGAPPAPGSEADKADRAAFARTTAGIGAPAWAIAKAQVFPTSDEVRAELGCALGRRLSAKGTPATIRLLERENADLKLAVDAGKAHYRRDRPFVGAADPRTCDPRTLGSFGGMNGGALSYSWPSGHAAIGRLTALTLSAAVPARKAALMQWGDALGANRLVCRVHWASDISAGRRLADAMSKKLVAEPAFEADVAAARSELSRTPPPTNCLA